MRGRRPGRVGPERTLATASNTSETCTGILWTFVDVPSKWGLINVNADGIQRIFLVCCCGHPHSLRREDTVKELQQGMDGLSTDET